MSTSKKMYVDPSHFESIIFGVARVCEALSSGPYGFTEAGIARGDSRDEQSGNALRFVEDYYELTAGVLELIAGAVGLIADGFSDGNLALNIVDDGTRSNVEGVSA